MFDAGLPCRPRAGAGGAPLGEIASVPVAGDVGLVGVVVLIDAGCILVSRSPDVEGLTIVGDPLDDLVSVDEKPVNLVRDSQGRALTYSAVTEDVPTAVAATGSGAPGAPSTTA